VIATAVVVADGSGVIKFDSYDAPMKMVEHLNEHSR
jgi:hypothetical protein